MSGSGTNPPIGRGELVELPGPHGVNVIAAVGLQSRLEPVALGGPGKDRLRSTTVVDTIANGTCYSLQGGAFPFNSRPLGYMLSEVSNGEVVVRKEIEEAWRQTTLWELLDLPRRSPVAVVGGGGKSSLLAAAAAEARQHGTRLLLTVTTRIALQQQRMADRTVYLAPGLGDDDLEAATPRDGEVVLVAWRPLEEAHKIEGVPVETVASLLATLRGGSVILEADGGAGADLKVPGPGEPVIPEVAATVVAVTGLPALGARIEEARVHRREVLEGLLPGQQRLSPALLAALLTHPEGSFKGAPPQARRIWLINKADGPLEMARAKAFAEEVLKVLRGNAGREGPQILAAGSLKNGTLAATELLDYYGHRETKNGAF